MTMAKQMYGVATHGPHLLKSFFEKHWIYLPLPSRNIPFSLPVSEGPVTQCTMRECWSVLTGKSGLGHFNLTCFLQNCPDPKDHSSLT